MPKEARSPEEVAKVKQTIIDETLDLIAISGYASFTMRKLASRLNIAAKTIYNYFENKDEICIYARERGFGLLYIELLKHYNAHDDPFEKLRAIHHAYVNFGVNNPDYYNLMFTWHVPRYKEYEGTSLESTATIEMEVATKIIEMFTTTFEGIADTYGWIDKKEASFYQLQFYTGAHGIVSTFNNRTLHYMTETPTEVLSALTETLLKMIKPHTGIAN